VIHGLRPVTTWAPPFRSAGADMGLGPYKLGPPFRSAGAACTSMPAPSEF